MSLPTLTRQQVITRGTRVQVSRHCPVKCYQGAVGKVVRIDRDDVTPYLVKFDSPIHDGNSHQSEMWFRACELELLP